MECTQARRMVAPFIKKELTEKEQEEFLKHVERCRDCMDELDIYFTVYKVLDTLDDGSHNEYDFRKMLEEEIRAAKYGIIRKRTFRVLRSALLVLAELLMILSVWTGYAIRQGEAQRDIFSRAIHRLYSREEPAIPAEETQAAAAEIQRETQAAAAEIQQETQAAAAPEDSSKVNAM